MAEFSYLKEKVRMLKSFGYKDHCNWNVCAKCPLSGLGREKMGIPCAQLETEYPEEAEDIVRKWASEHPVKTRKDVLLEKFPNVFINAKDDPAVCAKVLGIANDWDGRKDCRMTTCHECWNTPVEE